MDQLIEYIWKYWEKLPKDLLLHVWESMTTEELFDIAHHYISDLPKERKRMISLLSKHLFKS